MNDLLEKVFILGDWKDVARSIDSNSIDLILSDAPFGTELRNNREFNDSEDYVKNNINLWLSEMYRTLKENQHIYLYVPTLKLRLWLDPFTDYFTLLNILSVKCYDKNDYKPNNFAFDNQLILFGTKGEMRNARAFNKINWIKTSKSWFNDKRNKDPKAYTYHYPSYIPKSFKANYKNNAFTKTEHYTEKNRDLIEKLILISTNKNEIVLDCFSGAGNIPLTAIKLNRRAIAVEILEKYHTLSLARYKEYLRNPPIDKFIE